MSQLHKNKANRGFLKINANTGFILRLCLYADNSCRSFFLNKDVLNEYYTCIIHITQNLLKWHM